MRTSLHSLLQMQHFVEEKLCCVYRGITSIVDFEFLICNQTLYTDLYLQQLQNVHENLMKTCPALIGRRNVVLLHVDARLHSVWFMWAGLFYPILYIYQTLNQIISTFFILYKMLWLTKDFLNKVRLKYLWKNS